ncbi:class F sortase [Pseudonocardia sp. S2-4]|uniref:Class F sortase n=1 Tax=Pseudonocardia humida TaxID=2800819 RepID=A0ABT0ZVE8_9PSEU|nr:class F sortase [Pseudonocardia humida]
MGAFAAAPPGPHRTLLEAGPTGPAAGASGPLGRSVPVRLDIPAIDVHSGLLALGLDPDGTTEEPPLDSPDAGWYSHSPTPGEIGPAVLLGHVDSARTGPGVFHDLPALRPGDEVRVLRVDGSTAVFAVDRVARHPKSGFPTAEVYGDIPHAGLRLITCGGEFDRGTGHYRDNVVVYASAVTGGSQA